METPLDRLKVELDELEGKIDRLEIFMRSGGFLQLSTDAQMYLTMQYNTMKVYQGLLIMRGDLMEKEMGREHAEDDRC